MFIIIKTVKSYIMASSIDLTHINTTSSSFQLLFPTNIVASNIQG